MKITKNYLRKLVEEEIKQTLTFEEDVKQSLQLQEQKNEKLNGKILGLYKTIEVLSHALLALRDTWTKQNVEVTGWPAAVKKKKKQKRI